MCVLEGCLLDRRGVECAVFHPLQNKEVQRILEKSSPLHLLPLGITWDGKAFIENPQSVSQACEVLAGTERVGLERGDDTPNDQGVGQSGGGPGRMEREAQVENKQKLAEKGRGGEASADGEQMKEGEIRDGARLVGARVGMQGEEAGLLPIPITFNVQELSSTSASTPARSNDSAAATAAAALASTPGTPAHGDAGQSARVRGSDGGEIEGRGEDLEQHVAEQSADGSEAFASEAFAGAHARFRSAAEERTIEARANLERFTPLTSISLRSLYRSFLPNLSMMFSML